MIIKKLLPIRLFQLTVVLTLIIAMQIFSVGIIFGQTPDSESVQHYIVYPVLNEVQLLEITQTGATIINKDVDKVEIGATPTQVAALKALTYKVEPLLPQQQIDVPALEQPSKIYLPIILSSGQNDDSDTLALLRVKIQNRDDQKKVAETGVLVYTHRFNQYGQGIIWVQANQEQQNQLLSQGLLISILDLNTSNDYSYYIIDKHQSLDDFDDPLPVVITVLDTYKDEILVRVERSKEDIFDLFHVHLEYLNPHPLVISPQPQIHSASHLVNYLPTVQEIINQVQTTTIRNYIGGLSGEWPVTVGGNPYTILTRHTRSSGAEQDIEKATQYTYEHFQSLGLPVDYHYYTLSSSRGDLLRRNIVAEQVGLTEPDRVFVIGAHLDSLSETNSTYAPGANDNASGSATVLAVADALSQHNLGCTVRYILFTGEEQGKIGSKAYVADAFAQGDNLEATINLDMVGYNSDSLPEIQLITRSFDVNDLAIANLFVDVVDTYNINLLPYIVQNGSQGSDQISFWDYEYPAIFAFQGDSTLVTPGYHNTADTLSNVDISYAADYAKATIATMAHLGCLIEPIENLAVTGDNQVILTQSATLSASTTQGNNINYLWNFGDGSVPVSGGPIIQHTYPAIGTFIATVTATNATSIASATTTVVVAQEIMPEASFTSSSPDALGDITTFQNTSMGGNLSYTWNFGDGSIGTGLNPTHTYATVGSFTVLLTATNSAGSDLHSETILLQTPTPPLADFTHPGSEFINNVITFNNLSTGSDLTYAWDFGDGSISTDLNPTHIYITTGDFIVTLTAANNLGSSTISATLSIIQATPVAAPAGLYVSLVNSGVYNVGQVIAASNEDILRFNTDTVELIFDGSDVGVGSLDLDAFSFIDENTILMSFEKDATFGILGPVDDADIVQFKATSLGENTSGSFSLYFDGSDVGLDTNGEDIDAFTRLNDGRLLISTRSNSTVLGTSTQDDDILAFTPTSLGDSTSGSWAIYFNGADVGLDTTTDEDIDALTLNSAGQIYLSTIGLFSVTGVAGEDEDVFVCTPTSLGEVTNCTFASELFFDGTNWGIDSNDINGLTLIEQIEPPVASFTSSSPDDLGAVTELTNTSTGSNLTFDWDFGDGTAHSTELNPTHTYATVGNYTVTLTATNSSGPDTTSAIVTITAPPPPATEAIYLSLSNSGTYSVGGLSGVRDEDILYFDGSTFTMIFDGSDVGVGDLDLDAFEVIDGNTLLLSFQKQAVIGSLGVVEDHDIVQFNATSLGENSEGSFSMYFDGSDVGLDSSGEDIDALTLLPDGRLVLSVMGSASVPGLSTNDEDLLLFTPTSLGNTTAGQWQMYFDGSDEELATTSDEDIIGATLAANGNVYLTTKGAFAVSTLSGQNEDVSFCVPATLGDTTSCAFASNLYFEGQLWGLGTDSIDGLSLGSQISAALPPEAGFNTSSPDVFGQESHFFNTSTGLNLTFDWDFGDGTAHSTELNPTHTYATAGDFIVTLTAANNLGLDSYVTTVTIADSAPSLAPFYLSLNNWGVSTVGPLTDVKDEDILYFDGTTFSKMFDGSDVGVSALDVDAFHLVDNNTLLLSFHKAASIGTLGQVDDADIVQFDATTLGENTSGNFSWYLDGSDVGLGSNGEDIDALSILADGRILISTVGGVSVPGLSAKDEDLLAFTPTSLGSNTTGSWELYLDGSDVGLSTTGEDVNGLIVGENGKIYLTTFGNFGVSGLFGENEDVFGCQPIQLGDNTQCEINGMLYYQGSAWGITADDLDGLSFAGQGG